ncbi:MAG: alpha/beta hydrolase [Leadbetterella sp.]|nr:alpha/beta hydrolase [Leadbetterella sp.]
MRKAILTLMSFSFMMNVAAQEVIPLYPSGAPGLKAGGVVEKAPKEGGITRISNVIRPTITIYQPQRKTTDAAVVICPGGGYGILAYDHEGTELAEWFNARGMTAVVLKYRLPERDNFDNVSIRPLQDAQAAIRYIRKNAGKYGLAKDKIGIMGFSAGGHLAATASTLFDTQVGEITDPSVSVRPDFSLLIYPVISFDQEITHAGSKENLIGKTPSPEDEIRFSPEKQVKANTPPAFLVSTTDDWVSPENSIAYFLACKKNKVPVEMHIYEKGGHGYALKDLGLGPVQSWPDRLEDWLKSRGILK